MIILIVVLLIEHISLPHLAHLLCQILEVYPQMLSISLSLEEAVEGQVLEAAVALVDLELMSVDIP